MIGSPLRTIRRAPSAPPRMTTSSVGSPIHRPSIMAEAAFERTTSARSPWTASAGRSAGPDMAAVDTRRRSDRPMSGNSSAAGRARRASVPRFDEEAAGVDRRSRDLGAWVRRPAPSAASVGDPVPMCRCEARLPSDDVTGEPISTPAPAADADPAGTRAGAGGAMAGSGSASGGRDSGDDAGSDT